MILRGIYDRSLSNQPCIRGFARIKELARISKADEGYQRNIVLEQEEVVSNFLTDEKNLLFFPEVILSLKLKQDNTKEKEISYSPIQKIEEGKPFSSNIDSLKIKAVNKQELKNLSFDVTERNEINLVDIEFDDSELINMINNNNHPFHRIDGNHRLSAAMQVKGDRISKMNIPFCIVLFEEISEEKFDPQANQLMKITNKDYEKFERVVFSNINFKSLPLTEEQNLKVILDDEKNFSDEEIVDIFDDTWLYTRKLCKKVNIENYSGLEHILRDNIRTYSKKLFNIILTKDPSYDRNRIVNDVFESIKAIEQLYKNESKLSVNSSEGLFYAFLYYNITDKLKYLFFKDWVLKNNIFNIKEVKGETIINIFDKVVENKIKVFVAMPYFGGNVEIIEDYNRIYSETIEKINSKYPIDISLYPIMCNKGETQDQIQDIINKIKDCRIFFADITNNNANVSYELGWARALNKKVVLVKRKDTENPKSDYQNDTYHLYDDSARGISLGKVIEDNIVEILKISYGLIQDIK